MCNKLLVIVTFLSSSYGSFFGWGLIAGWCFWRVFGGEVVFFNSGRSLTGVVGRRGFCVLFCFRRF